VIKARITRIHSPSQYYASRCLIQIPSGRRSLHDTTTTTRSTPQLWPNYTRKHSAWDSSHGQSNLQLHLRPSRSRNCVDWMNKAHCHRTGFVARRVARTRRIGKWGDLPFGSTLTSINCCPFKGMRSVCCMSLRVALLD
jgi:hypothetical protein